MEKFEELKNICDLWSYLKASTKPIVLYGMGDGADKILNVCQDKNIEIFGVFASDDFVRGQKFRGFTVKKYSELKQMLGDMIVLVSFATKLKDVLENIYNICKYDEIYAPDVPVFGDGIFDSEYFNLNYDSFFKVYNFLSDELSKKVYYNIIKYKLTGNIMLLAECQSDVSEAYRNIIQPHEGDVYVDIGAYNGDTIKEYVSFSGNKISVYAFEPDDKNYRKLVENTQKLDLSEKMLYNLAAWDKKEDLVFYSRSGRNSAHTTFHKGLKDKTVCADAVDNYIDRCVSFVNIDAEGSDLKALYGMTNTIEKYKPTISCAIYHRNEDMFTIPLFLAEKYKNFKMYIRHFPYIPAWDTNIYIKSIETE